MLFATVIKKIQPFIMPLILTFSLLFSTIPVQSKTLQEVESEIQQKKDELSSLEENLKKAESLASYYESQKNNASSDLDSVKAELKQLEAEVKANNLNIKKVKQQLKLKKLEVEERDFLISDKLVELYISYKDGLLDTFLSDGEMSGFWKQYQYQESLLNDDIDGLTTLSKNVKNLQKKYADLQALLASLQKENENLSSKRTELEGQIAYLSGQEDYNKEVQSGIRAQMVGVQQQIEGLTEEQKRIIEEETKLIKGANGGTKPLVKGEYYFYGVGRSLYQGHGLGFSQYGAKGGALHGMNAVQIARFYYTGSSITTVTGSISVIGYGAMNIETYVAGLGEVPDYACGTQQQVNNRPDKYRVPDSNYWEGGCWPEEAIKAQVIVARSYAYAYGGSICTTAVCQVYKGGTAKKWAADETKGKVLQAEGSVIKAYYSSDNHNGWGTGTHRNPIWCWDFNGNCGSGFSWLQSVNDSSFTAKGPYTDWTWRTNSYTIEEIESMLNWYASMGYINSTNARQLLNTIGSIKDLRMQRDASGRVARVVVSGSKGSNTINGETFKQIYNLWVGNNQPSGEVDPIFSLTFYFIKY